MFILISYHFQQSLEAKDISKRRQQFRFRQLEHASEDLKYCHPRWAEEQRYLDQEIERIKRDKSSNYFGNAWNVIDWAIHLAIWVIIATRIMVIIMDDEKIKLYHVRIYALSLILVWLRVLKACRAFQALGPFITLLGYVCDDTLKFAFLFFEFFIPYVCAFYMLFGGKENAMIMISNDQDASGWQELNDLVYSVYQITLLGSFSWEALASVDKLMAQVIFDLTVPFE